MCMVALASVGTALSGLFGGGASAAGATAAASAGSAAATGVTVGQVLTTAGTIASVGGTLWQGIASSRAASAQADYLAQQSAVERQLALVEDQRTRDRMRGAIAQQRAELAGRGISLDSPTAVLLGRRAAEEMSFSSQSVRSNAAARQTELGVAESGYRARATTALLTGTLSAAGSLLGKAPDLWPGLADRRVR